MKPRSIPFVLRTSVANRKWSHICSYGLPQDVCDVIYKKIS